jgi:hypothetical protein
MVAQTQKLIKMKKYLINYYNDTNKSVIIEANNINDSKIVFYDNYKGLIQRIVNINNFNDFA